MSAAAASASAAAMAAAAGRCAGAAAATTLAVVNVAGMLRHAAADTVDIEGGDTNNDQHGCDDKGGEAGGEPGTMGNEAALELALAALARAPRATAVGLRLLACQAALALRRCAVCQAECKRVVAEARSWQRLQRDARRSPLPGSCATAAAALGGAIRLATGGLGVERAVSRAYRIMGEAFEVLGGAKRSKAVSCYVLALKSLRAVTRDGKRAEVARVPAADSDSGEAERGTDPEAEVEARAIRERLLALAPPAAAGPALPDAPAPAEQRAADIEDLLAMHTTVGYGESFKFQCTGCGECCRTSDMIWLSPNDLWRMSRSDAMALHGVRTTRALRGKRGPDGKPLPFASALHYTLKDGMPVCFLRPVKSKTGACHFAYPLHARDAAAPATAALPGPTPGQETGAGQVAAGAVKAKAPSPSPAHALLAYAEVKELELREYTPVDASEYNLTEAEEEAAIRAMQEAEGREEKAPDDDDAGGERADDAGGSDGDDSAQRGDEAAGTGADAPYAVLNSFGRQALGCMLGAAAMPAMCASYPLARELNQADFWHVPAPTRSCASATNKAPATAGPSSGTPDHMAEAEYVVVKSASCEGFFPDGQARTEAWESGPGARVATSQTVERFTHGSSELASRWAMNDRFVALLGRVEASGVMRTVGGGSDGARAALVQYLGRIWYDFDGLRAARTRPFKSWARVERTIEEATMRLCRAAVQFFETRDAGSEQEPGGTGDSDVTVTAEFKACVSRLGIFP